MIRIFLFILITFPLQINLSYGQKVKLTIWNYYLDKFGVSKNLSPLDGFCFNAFKSISSNSKTGEKVTEDINIIYIIINDDLSNQKKLYTGGFNEKINMYNMRIRTEEEMKILSTQKNFFSPNVCKMEDNEGRKGMLKFNRDRLSVYDESDRLIGEFSGTLLSNEKIEIYLYNTLNFPDLEKIF